MEVLSGARGGNGHSKRTMTTDAKRHRSRDGKSERNYSGKKNKSKRKKKVRKEGSEAWLYYILICLPYSASEQRSAST